MTQQTYSVEQIERIKKSADINNARYEIGHAINDIELLLDMVEAIKAENEKLKNLAAHYAIQKIILTRRQEKFLLCTMKF